MSDSNSEREELLSFIEKVSEKQFAQEFRKKIALSSDDEIHKLWTGMKKVEEVLKEGLLTIEQLGL